MLLAIAASAASASPTGPESKTPADVGIAYDIVACRMPRAENQHLEAFPDASSLSLYIGRGTDLVLIHPDGSEEVLFDAGTNGGVVDPLVSFDGRTVFFSFFEDPENFNPQRKVSKSPAHLWKIDLVTRVATQLTFGDKPAFGDTAHAIDPQYAQFDVAPVELPDGRLLFLSNREGALTQTKTGNGFWPSMNFWRMHADGTNLEPMERFSLSGCQHPFILQDGRIAWTHYQSAGRRYTLSYFPLFVANQDLSDLQTLAGAHSGRTTWHFATQLSDGDIVSSAYYHVHNFGAGSLVRFPIDAGHSSGSHFTPISDNGSLDQKVDGLNTHFDRVGQSMVTPWALTLSQAPSLDHDGPSVILADGSHAGKTTMPAALPGGHLLFVWSDGPVHSLLGPSGYPNMKLAYAANAILPQRNDLVILKESASEHYFYPRPVVRYFDIHGIQKPALTPEQTNDGSATAALPAGGPFATTGTSSVYNRESRWSHAYDDAFDKSSANSWLQGSAINFVGQDSRAFADADIHATQIVVDMTHSDTRYAKGYDIRSHNNGLQVWGVLGELPLRKFDELGEPILDPLGDPDTSYEVRIPADIPFHHRLVDRNGLRLTSEETWHSARPGERKTNCGGCHAHSTDVSSLDFSLTAAAKPGYTIHDFALRTPMIDESSTGESIVTVLPERAYVVEYHRDVKPIFEAKCVSCHGDVHPAGGLDLQGDDAVDALAFDAAASGIVGTHQATRWIRKHAANRSLLAWKVFGERLDGETNADRNDDIDYVGEIMPPATSGTLTFAEKRTIALWIDLGCLTTTWPQASSIGDPLDDQMAPTLTISGVRPGLNDATLPPIAIGAYDLHSGVDPASLDVRVTPNGGTESANLAAGSAPQDGDVVTLTLPTLAPDLVHEVDVSVRDLNGNTSRRHLSVIPCSGSFVDGGSGCGALPPVLSGEGCPSPGLAIRLRVADAPGGAFGLMLVSSGLASLPFDPDCTLGLTLPATIVPLFLAGTSPGEGELDLNVIVPPFPGATAHAQFLFADALAPHGTVMTNVLTIHVGG